MRKIFFALLGAAVCGVSAASAGDPEGIMFFSENERNPDFAKDPAVVRFNGRYLMYYSIPAWPKEDPRSEKGWGIGVAESSDLVNWKYVKELDLQKCSFCAPGARVVDGKVHLFYQSAGGYRGAIWHAESGDGLNFANVPEEPVFVMPVRPWSCGRVIDADVIEYHGTRYLYAATRDPEFRIQKLVAGTTPAHAKNWFSNWKLAHDASILEPELPWEKSCIEAPATLIHNDKIYLFYGGAYNNAPQQIGCAVSSDGIHFTRISSDPLLPNGRPGAWNSSESGHPFAFTDDNGQQYLFFQGNDTKGKTWHLSCKKILWENDIPRLEDLKKNK